MNKRELVIHAVFQLTLLTPITVIAQVSAPHAIEPPILGLSLSGGGIRAAAFAYGVMIELDNIKVIPSDEIRSGQCVINTQATKREIDTVVPSKAQAEKPNPTCESSSLLESFDYISTVSGGTMTAGYYLTHSKRQFMNNLRGSLEDMGILRRLFFGDKLSWSKTVDIPTLLSPFPMLLASSVDIALAPLRIPFSYFDIRFPELTPITSLSFVKSIFRGNQLAAIYDKALFGDREVGLGQLDDPKPGKKRAQLLVNATDLSSGRTFTFNEKTFRCMGAQGDFKKFPLAMAAAASSALPGIFSPLDLSQYLSTYNPEGRDLSDCATVEWQKTRPTRLVDGGISDNLGLLSLLGKIFEDKSQRNGGNGPKKRAFIVAVNAAISESSTVPFEIAKNIDDSFDVLMTNKTDLTRTLFEERLANFGIAVVEFRLSDVLRNENIIHRIAASLKNSPGLSMDDDKVHEVMNAGFEHTQIEQRIFNDLNKLGLYPTSQEVETLIEAGRAIVRQRADTLLQRYDQLRKRRFIPNCNNVITPETSYCWPAQFNLANVLSASTGVMLKDYMAVTEGFFKTSTENRLRYIKEMQSTNREWLRLKNSYGHMPIKKFFSSFEKKIAQDEQYYDLTGNSAMKASISSFSACYLPIFGKNRSNLETVFKDAPKSDDPPDELCRRHKDYCRGLTTLQEEIKSTCMPSSQNRGVGSPWLFRVIGRLSAAVNSSDQAIRYLDQGLQQYPHDMNLNAFMGYYRIIYRADYLAGIRYMRRALSTADSHLQELEHLKMSTLEGTYADLKQRYVEARQIFMAAIAYYSALSSTPLPGDESIVSHQDVEEWLAQHFPPLTESTLSQPGQRICLESETVNSLRLTLLTPELKSVFRRKIAQEFMRHDSSPLPVDQWLAKPENEGRVQTWIETNVAELFSPSTARLNSWRKNPFPPEDEWFCLGSQQGTEQDATLTKSLISLLREGARKHVVDVSGLKQAERMVQSLYAASTHLSNEHRRQIADAYGLILLIRNGEFECPRREGAIRNALRYFEEAREALLKEQPVNGDDPDMELEIEELDLHSRAAASLACSLPTEQSGKQKEGQVLY
ncbi:MAG: patatin-like phospholipase family protein [Nitrospira sp.]|nr:patatin-like phospholipase family protein [Nitrospira sp.]